MERDKETNSHTSISLESIFRSCKFSIIYIDFQNKFSRKNLESNFRTYLSKGRQFIKHALDFAHVDDVFVLGGVQSLPQNVIYLCQRHNPYWIRLSLGEECGFQGIRIRVVPTG